MTTTIIIKTTSSNAVRAQLLSVGDNVPIGEPSIVDKGSEQSMYLHSSQDIHLHEMTADEYAAAMPTAEDEGDNPENDDDDDPD